MADGVPANVPVSLPKKKGFPRPFGRYILERSLSRGGMGEIFLAVPKGVDARCVIKTIRTDLTGDKEFVGRFADEAKIMTRIAHENIIRIFDCGKVGGDYYIAMEYLFGRDLGDILDRAYERGEPLPVKIGLYLTRQMLLGLDYIHHLTARDGRPMNLVHRDISPQNVLVSFKADIKLIDFGLARTELLPGRTQGALAVGKYGYMSPEQARHEKIDGRADLYSLGVMLFEVFTGDRLVDEQDQATLWSRVLNPKHRRPRAVLPSLTKEIDELIMTAVGVKPEDRFSDARAMLDYVDSMKLDPGTPEELLDYVRYLYPHADFEPPPIADLSAASGESEYSMIIAMSEDAAKSVFGRGVLPVEFTQQVRMTDILPELEKRRQQKQDDFGIDQTIHETGGMDHGRHGVLVASQPSAVELKMSGGMFRNSVSEEAPTTIRHADGALPAGILADSEETAYARPPAGAREISSNATRAIPQVVTPTADKFRDEEMTVMMDVPPAPVAAVFAGEELTNEEAQQATRVRPDDQRAKQAAQQARRGRQIKERRAKPTTAETAAPAVAMRATVGTEPKQPRRRRPQPEYNELTDEETLPPELEHEPAPNWLLLGLILMGITIIILLIMLLIQK